MKTVRRWANPQKGKKYLNHRTKKVEEVIMVNRKSVFTDRHQSGVHIDFFVEFFEEVQDER